LVDDRLKSENVMFSTVVVILSYDIKKINASYLINHLLSCIKYVHFTSNLTATNPWFSHQDVRYFIFKSIARGTNRNTM